MSVRASTLTAHPAFILRTVQMIGKRLQATHNSWKSMLQRCTNARLLAYKYYGAIGVTVSPKWRTFEGFLEDMGTRPAGTSLGRLLDTGDYTVGIARWMTRSEQGKERIRKRLRKKYGENYGTGSTHN
jgi:hypothetical protein